MRRLDALSDLLAPRLGDAARQKLHVSVMCDCGEEFAAHRETAVARCPTCHMDGRVLPDESEAIIRRVGEPA